MPLVSFYIPWKHQKTSGFLMFSGGIERDQWHEMDQCTKTRLLTVVEQLQLIFTWHVKHRLFRLSPFVCFTTIPIKLIRVKTKLKYIFSHITRNKKITKLCVSTSSSSTANWNNGLITHLQRLRSTLSK